jgi:hypothetical protein
MSQADRFNEGKPKLSYLLEFSNAGREIAGVCEFGAKKYSRNNYKKGLPYTETIDAALRHITKFLDGKDIDEESGCHHMAHAAWGCMALLEFINTHPEFDDRGKEDVGKIIELPKGAELLPNGGYIISSKHLNSK